MTPTVLIVDDDADVREALELVVGLAGFPVATARNGEEALEFLRGHRGPCTVLLDLMMPVMDGWAVLDAVQAEGLVPLDRILVLTAFREPHLPAGVRLLPKPMTVDCIVDAIRGVA
jgi:CheY-like chemotaxis protein